jgi:hypothetical protein
VHAAGVLPAQRWVARARVRRPSAPTRARPGSTNELLRCQMLSGLAGGYYALFIAPVSYTAAAPLNLVAAVAAPRIVRGSLCAVTPTVGGRLRLAGPAGRAFVTRAAGPRSGLFQRQRLLPAREAGRCDPVCCPGDQAGVRPARLRAHVCDTGRRGPLLGGYALDGASLLWRASDAGAADPERRESSSHSAPARLRLALTSRGAQRVCVGEIDPEPYWLVSCMPLSFVGSATLSVGERRRASERLLNARAADLAGIRVGARHGRAACGGQPAHHHGGARLHEPQRQHRRLSHGRTVAFRATCHHHDHRHAALRTPCRVAKSDALCAQAPCSGASVRSRLAPPSLRLCGSSPTPPSKPCSPPVWARTCPSRSWATRRCVRACHPRGSHRGQRSRRTPRSFCRTRTPSLSTSSAAAAR